MCLFLMQVLKQAATGEEISAEDLGGASVHCKISEFLIILLKVLCCCSIFFGLFHKCWLINDIFTAFSC